MKRFIACMCVSMVFPATAWAETVCMDAAEMEAALIDWYGETPVSGASADAQQLWASPDTGTWTLMELKRNGTACVLGQGDDWLGSSDLLLALERSLGRDGTHATPETIAFLDDVTTKGG
ncbi:hypothetical protein [uncultured Tateyamaria sp.]|uniref:hypothetical protein n=1 Tax=uncultured Tateyamaria sp. TaxID=455651 RepID=UPI0026196A23|nr:hypothetical protein [uncultured Tateyamaria sp.]